ncbi:hypothetical protein [Rugamonas rivuli]|uniref:Uncharacterized protein n=1 Tax=Rugamonas rivuli TaxID=2743358 RepID=A0A843SJJ6_9BURK|nr:hypothetical protein [Rugamonas rivuli]MQA23452.1 hypothetical protein [Rugamonas rivuli]
MEENNMSYYRSSATFFAPQSIGESNTSGWDVSPAVSLPLPAPAKSAAVPTTKDVRVKQVIRGGNNVNTGAPPVFLDVAVHPGEFLSAAVVEREKTRDMLITSIRRFASETSDAYRLTSETADASVALIKALRNSMRLPKIAPDGEGGLMAVWEGEHPVIALVVDNWKMHMVTGAATDQAEYFDDLPFDGIRLPKEILEFIPKF